MRHRRLNHLSLLTLIHNPKLHCQHPQLMMLPCHFPTTIIHHHGSFKNQKHRGVLPNRTQQRSFHSTCRRHPCRFLRHGKESNLSTGDPIIPPPPWFDKTPPPPSTSQEDILPLAPSFDETPPLKTAQPPSVAKRRRSGTLHLENPVPKRWQSDTLYPETPVPTTQLRWRAGVLRALRPFRRLRGKQPDPSEVSVKRPRLAPAQVMSTALAKSCGWSLGVDERGPAFDEINKDWRHSIFLTGRAAREEVHFASESPENQRLLHVNGTIGRSTRQHCHRRRVNCAC